MVSKLLQMFIPSYFELTFSTDSCDVADAFEDEIGHCYSQRKAGNEHSSYGVGWTDSGNESERSWRWSSSSDLDGYGKPQICVKLCYC